MEQDAHNCARVMGPLGYLKRRPYPNDTNYAINVPRVCSPLSTILCHSTVISPACHNPRLRNHPKVEHLV